MYSAVGATGRPLISSVRWIIGNATSTNAVFSPVSPSTVYPCGLTRSLGTLGTQMSRTGVSEHNVVSDTCKYFKTIAATCADTSKRHFSNTKLLSRKAENESIIISQKPSKSSYDNDKTLQRKTKVNSLTSSDFRSSRVKDMTKLDELEWNTVYRFDHIRVCRAIQKLKIYQTAFTTCIALPGSVGLYFFDAIPPEHVAFMLGSSVFACAMLYIMGTFCSRLIGIIYSSTSDPTLVRIAHLNFWGLREDTLFKKSEIVPFSELPDNVSDIYVNVKFYSESDSKLHVCLRYGQVYDKYEFEDIFGSTADFYIREAQPRPDDPKNRK